MVGLTSHSETLCLECLQTRGGGGGGREREREETKWILSSVKKWGREGGAVQVCMYVCESGI